MYNVQRRIRNAAKKGKFISVIDRASRSLYRDGPNSVRSSAIQATMKKVTDDLVRMGFRVEFTEDDYLRIYWE
jgi:hypothetical protein